MLLLKNMLWDRKGDYVSDDEINEALNRQDIYGKTLLFGGFHVFQRGGELMIIHYIYTDYKA